jgi:hypothetical protein
VVFLNSVFAAATALTGHKEMFAAGNKRDLMLYLLERGARLEYVLQ